MPHEFVDGANVEMPFRDPADHLDVPESARASLHVGFELVRGVVVAMMPGALFGAFRLEKAVRRPDFLGRDRLLHLREEIGRTIDQPCLDQRRRDRNIVGRFLAALAHRAHAVADFQPDVPERGKKIGERVLCGFGNGAGGEHHDVYVGVRMQFATPVSADCHERRVAGGIRRIMTPQAGQQDIDQLCPPMYQLGNRRTAFELAVQARRRLLQSLPAHTDRLAQIVESGFEDHERILSLCGSIGSGGMSHLITVERRRASAPRNRFR